VAFLLLDFYALHCKSSPCDLAFSRSSGMALNGILLIASSASAGGEAGYMANGKKKGGGCYKRDERKEADFQVGQAGSEVLTLKS
jgi:hypothetical protein